VYLFLLRAVSEFMFYDQISASKTKWKITFFCFNMARFIAACWGVLVEE
jgi:hypothetical protein